MCGKHKFPFLEYPQILSVPVFGGGGCTLRGFAASRLFVVIVVIMASMNFLPSLGRMGNLWPPASEFESRSRESVTTLPETRMTLHSGKVCKRYTANRTQFIVTMNISTTLT